MPVSAEMAAILAEMKALNDSFLTDRSTNSRTGLTRDVRVSRDTGRVRIPNMTPFLPLPRWFLDFTDDMDVKAADRETVTGEAPGTYAVLEVIDPTSLGFSTECIAVLAQNADGSLAFPTNQTVTFSDPKDNARITAPTRVLIEWITDEQRADGVQGTWRVYYPESLRYPDHTQVSYDDSINWTRSPNPFPTGSATLSNPVHPYPGILPIVMATFVEER